MDSLGMDRVGIRRVSMLIRGGGEGLVRGCLGGVWLRWLVVVVWTFCFREGLRDVEGDGKYGGMENMGGWMGRDWDEETEIMEWW